MKERCSHSISLSLMGVALPAHACVCVGDVVHGFGRHILRAAFTDKGKPREEKRQEGEGGVGIGRVHTEREVAERSGRGPEQPQRRHSSGLPFAPSSAVHWLSLPFPMSSRETDTHEKKEKTAVHFRRDGKEKAQRHTT